MRLKLIKLLVKGLDMTDDEVRSFRDTGWTLATNDQIASDANYVASKAYKDGLVRGKNLGHWDVLRYTKENPKWQDIADKFDFDSLNEKYSQERLP